MFSFADAKVRQFCATDQIYKQESAKTFPFIDINQIEKWKLLQKKN